jgi:hypothetical protein
MSEPIASPTVARAPAAPRGSARQAWAQRLQRFADSGLRPAQFCAQEGVSLPNFYAWRRRLNTETPRTTTSASDRPGPTLLPVRLAPQQAPLELVLPSGALVRIAADTDIAALHRLLQLLGVLPC